jgi:hypothetical protein
MPRRAAASNNSEGDEDESTFTESAAAGVDSPSPEMLNVRAREYLELTQQLKEVGAQAGVLRKSLKGVEKSLLNGMLVSGMEELDVDGVKILRTRKLQMKDD